VKESGCTRALRSAAVVKKGMQHRQKMHLAAEDMERAPRAMDILGLWGVTSTFTTYRGDFLCPLASFPRRALAPGEDPSSTPAT